MTTALLLKIGAESSALRGELAKANGMVNQFAGQMTKMGGVLAGVFSAGAVASFVFEVSKLAAQAEGVNSAFSKIPNSTKLLMDMKAATEGTVDNLTLMQLGVQAFNNNAPLKELPEILNFIDRTADATNQDFKALADTIINNIGKESTKGLNELGLNIQKIKERGDEIGFVPALMEEINRKSAELGDVQSENADNLDRLNASWQNYKIFIGEAANSTGVLGQSVTALTGTLDILASRNLTFWEKLAGLVGGPAGAAMAFAKEYTAQAKKQADEQKKSEQVVREVDRAYVEFNKNLEAYGKVITTHIYKNELLAEFQKRLNAEAEHAASLIENEKNLTEKLNDKKEEALTLTGASRAAINLEIKQLEEKIKKLRELGLVQQQTAIKPPPVPPLQTNPIQATGALVDPKAITAQIQSSLQQLNTVTQTTTPEISAAFIDMSASVQNAMAGMAVGFGESIGNMISGVGGIEELAASVVSVMGAMATQLGQTMIQFGVVGLALKAFTKNPVGAIAAGVALVALGKLLSNKASSIVGGGAGRGGSSGGGSSVSNNTRNSLTGNTQDIALTGEVKINNNDLVVALSNANNRNKYTRA